MWWTGALRIYEDGDVWGLVFRKFHPVTLIFAAVVIIPCALTDDTLLEVVPCQLPYPYIMKESEIIWWSPWSKRQGRMCDIAKKDEVV